MITKDHVLNTVTDYYLNSGDFNGTHVNKFEIEEVILKTLIQEGKLDLVRGDGHPNPHIKAHKADDSALQLEKIERYGWGHGCLYPTPEHLSKIVSKEDYLNEPFRYDLALGKPSLEHGSFDVRVLEYYLNDPRFDSRITESHGSIFISDHTAIEEGAKDDILLERFGFGFKPNGERVVAILYWDLLKLDKAQQLHWKQFQFEGTTKLHPEFSRTSLSGQFPKGFSLYVAIVQEMSFINQLCNEIKIQKVFKNDFTGENTPKSFHFLIRPTKKNYHDFMSLLDKMLSENINSKILRKKERQIRELNSDGEIEVRYKGSITILQNWLEKFYNFTNADAPKEILESIRQVRKIRQQPAHKINQDLLDNDFFGRQERILIDVFYSLSTIRKILESHPKVSKFELPSWYDEEEIQLSRYPKP